MASTINFLRLLADPTRLRLLLLLEEDELSVAELQEILGMGQSRISSHLAQLKRAGVVEDRRSGKNVYYGLTAKEERNAARGKVSELIRALAREMPETARDRTALQLALRKRRDKAREYFDELAGKFGRSYVPGPILAGARAHPNLLLTGTDCRRSRSGRRNPLAAPGQDRAQSDRGR